MLSNALDACPHAAQITVSWQIQGGRLCVLIADNGPGWPAALLPSLLKPFTTSKTVGLGIGLSICVSLMTQMEGALRHSPSLLKPFTTSKTVGLGIGLSICVSLMTQMEGALRLASTFTQCLRGAGIQFDGCKRC